MDNVLVQKIPAAVEDYIETNCYVGIFLHAIDCIDRVNADYTVWEEGNEIRPDLAGGFFGFFKMKVIPERLNGFDMVRVKGFEHTIIVSEVLKNRMESMRLTGVRFEEV